MTAYIDIIDRLLYEKTGKRACELDYMEPPDDEEKFDTRFSIGNIHLIAGRIRTKIQANKLVNKFLNTAIC